MSFLDFRFPGILCLSTIRPRQQRCSLQPTINRQPNNIQLHEKESSRTSHTKKIGSIKRKMQFIHLFILGDISWLSTEHVHSDHTSQRMSNNMYSPFILKIRITPTKHFPYSICFSYYRLKDRLFVT